MEKGFIYENRELTVELYRESLSDFDEVISDIDTYIVDLVYADPLKDITVAKAKVKNFISSKDTEGKMGIVSEMMAHILIRKKLGMEHLSLMVSLEDYGLKKGFDGVYRRNDEVWFGESKSSMRDGYLHKSNVDDALTCFRNKINGTSNNNPWNNAINHFFCIEKRVRVSDTLRRRISDLSDDFERHIYSNAEEFNVIPISTLFVSDSQLFNSLIDDIDEVVKEFGTFNKMIVLCIGNELFARIVAYLEGR